MMHIPKIFLFSFLGSLSLFAAETRPQIKKDVHKEVRQEIKKTSPKRLWVDFGVGLPQLASLEVGYRLLPRWQLGLSYGTIPGGQGIYSKTFDLPSQNVTLKNKDYVTFTSPTLTSSLVSIAPFVRFFPGTTNFYFQMTMAVLQNKNTFKSGLSDIYGVSISDGGYGGTITVLQFLPTASIGHAFATELFFFNVSMGLTFIATAQASVSASGQIPDRLGGTAANQDALDQLNTKTTTAINKAVEALRSEVPVIPSIHLTVGFMF